MLLNKKEAVSLILISLFFYAHYFVGFSSNISDLLFGLNI